MPLVTRLMPSGPRMRTVAVGMPMLPHTTCAWVVGGGRKEEDGGQRW